MEMPWQRKLDAFQALGDTCLRMRKPGDWYVEAVSVMVKEDPKDCTVVGIYGNGATPEAAVLDHWRKLVDELPAKSHLVIERGSRRVRWNGYMWRDVTA
jgi:hypothetical protein